MTLVKFNDGNKSVLAPGFTDVFESFFNDSFISDRMISRVPAVNISETDGKYHIELAAPGLKKEDFKVSLDRNILNISAEKKSEHHDDNKKYNKREYSYSSFVRSFSLPDSADDAHIEAEYNNGILNVAVAKKEEAKMATRQISIK
jgi:HSP20 family protein